MKSFLLKNNLDVEINDTSEKDFEGITELLASVGLPSDKVEENLASFITAEINGALVGTAGMEVYSKSVLLRSFAVAQTHQGLGLGKILYDILKHKALELGITRFYLLTFSAEDFFAAKGFKVIDRSAVDKDVMESSVEFKINCCATAVCMLLEVS